MELIVTVFLKDPQKNGGRALAFDELVVEEVEKMEFHEISIAVEDWILEISQAIVAEVEEMENNE